MNPHSNQRSCYLRPVSAKQGVPDYVTSTGAAPNQLALHYARLFYSHVTNAGFPCTLGKSAYRSLSFRFSLFNDLGNVDDLNGLCHDAFQFVHERGTISPKNGVYETYAAAFLDPLPASEMDFEGALWRVLQHLHDADQDKWDPVTSSDPANPSFSFSFCGHSFFLVGLHPQASRISRRFPLPTFVFNAHAQFEDLRKRNKFIVVQDAIRRNDIALQGCINPSLTNYGLDSEAKQYSGRLVEKDWICPFKSK